MPGGLQSDAQCVVASEGGLSLLGATHARFDGDELLASTGVDQVDLNAPQAAASLSKISLRAPTANVGVAVEAPPHRVRWSMELAPGANASAEAVPVRVTRLASAALQGTGSPDTLLVATAGGTLLALAPDGSTRWRLEMGAQLNDVVADDLSGDGRDEIVLAREDYNVQVLDAAGQELWRRALSYYRRPPRVNLVRTGDIDGDGAPEVVAGGENWRFYAFDGDGSELWNYESVHPSRSGAVADLDGDGRAEVICGTHYYWASVLGSDGTPRWQYRFGPICYDMATGRFDGDGSRGVVFGSGDGNVHYVDARGKPRMVYATGDEVKHVAAGDLDGDGLDEILAGSLNYNLYCFGADARRRWRLDLGGPISALVIVPKGGGAWVIAGTGKGRLVSVDAAGTVRALTELDAEIVDLLATPDSVIVATVDGRLRSVSTAPD
jgi:hypothetical protein